MTFRRVPLHLLSATSVYIVNNHSQQVAAGSTLVTVNQRLARHHLVNYQQWQLDQGKLWWETPAILPMRAWLGSIHASALASGLTSKTLLPDLLQQKAWNDCIEQDASVQLLNVEAAASAARQAWQLSCAWRCYNPEDDYLSLDQYTWQRWSSLYKRYLDTENYVDEASLADHLVELIEQGVLQSLLPAALILEGFLELSPQLTRLIEAIKLQGVQVILNTAIPRAATHHVQYADDAEQWLGIAAQMRQELEFDGSQSLGLVVPELQQQRAAVMRAFDRVFFPSMSPDEIRSHGRPYDLSLGQPLSDTSVVMAGLSLLTLCTSSIEGSEISAVLLSPYIKASTSEARRREQLDRRLRDNRVRSLTLELLQQHWYSGSQLNQPIGRLLKRRKLNACRLSEWAARFSDWLKLLGWPGQSIDTEEYQAYSAWLECLDDMQLLDDGDSLSALYALSLLKRLARDRVFQLDTPGTPIQIMGRLESHGIAFDCLWVAGLDAEQWPPSGSPSAFLSISSQKAQGVPDASAAARLALAEKEFVMWCSQAPLIVVSRAEMRDGKMLGAAALPVVQVQSPNTTDLEARLMRLNQASAPANPLVLLQTTLSCEQIVDDYGPALAPDASVGGGARLFENQALCPFKAFATHRLVIRPLEEAGLGLDPRQHGNLLHKALELFWGKVRTHTALMELSAEELEEQLLSCIDTALIDESVPKSLSHLERLRLQALLMEWLKYYEAPRESFEVLHLEQRLEIEHGGITMNVILDRIDKVGDALVLIDYKTGISNRINTWADQRIVNPQLPLYVLSDEAMSGATFAQIARNNSGFKGIASDSGLIPKVGTSVKRSGSGQAAARELETWEDWRAHWREALDAIALEVRQGLASVTPMHNACTHCELKSLCRVDENRLLQAGDEWLLVDTRAGVSR